MRMAQERTSSGRMLSDADFEALAHEAERGHPDLGDWEAKPTYDPNRWTAVCACGWSTVSTGPQAQRRVCALAAAHRCYPRPR